MEENQLPQSTPDMAPETTSPPTPEQMPTASLEGSQYTPITPVVPVLPAPQPLSMETPPTPRKKKPTRLIVGGIIAAAIVLLGGGAALAYTQWYQNPDKVVHDAIIKAVQAKSVSMNGDISYTAKDVDIKLALDSKSQSSNGEVHVKASVDMKDLKHTFTADGTARVIGDTVYVKLSGIQKIVDDMTKETDGQLPSYVGMIVKKIDDKWLSIKASDYEDTSKEISEQQKCLTKLTEKIQSDKAMMNEVTTLYKKHQIITVDKNLGSKSVNGVGSLGYEVEANKDAAVAFVKGLNDTALGKEVKSCSKDVNFDDIAKSISDEDSSTSKAEGKVELWVSRFGHDITEVTMSGKDSDTTLTAALRPLFNTTITVETPKDATSFKTLIDDIQGAFMESYMNTTTSESIHGNDNMSEHLFQAA